MTGCLSIERSRFAAECSSPTSWRYWPTRARRQAGRLRGSLPWQKLLATIAKTGERFYQAELYRLKGELLRRGGHGAPPAALVPEGTPGGPGSAEECLLTAIEIAREQGARLLELRAVVSLGRLWCEQGREAGARRMLLDACGAFTEGLDTVDLREARALLNAMPAAP